MGLVCIPGRNGLMACTLEGAVECTEGESIFICKYKNLHQ